MQLNNNTVEYNATGIYPDFDFRGNVSEVNGNILEDLVTSEIVEKSVENLSQATTYITQCIENFAAAASNTVKFVIKVGGSAAPSAIINFALSVSDGEEGFQALVSSTASGVASTVTFGGIVLAAGTSVTGVTAAILASALVGYAVDKKIDDTFDYYQNRIQNFENDKNSAINRQAVNVKYSGSDSPDEIKKVVERSGALELDSNIKVTIENKDTGKKFEVVYGNQYQQIINKLKDMGFYSTDTYNQEYYIKGAYELSFCNENFREMCGSIDSQEYFLIEEGGTYIFPTQGNNLDNKINSYDNFEKETSNHIYGLGGNDHIQGGKKDDVIYGDYGAGWQKYAKKDYRMIFGDSLTGNDTLIGLAGNDQIHGGEGHDYLFGGSGNDVLFGEDGNDFIYGGSGNDVLIGGAGANYLYGESGYDVYFTSGSEGSSWIHDSDGKGTVNYNGIYLKGGKRAIDGINEWFDSFGNRYYFNESGLVINNDNVVIGGFKNGDLGITLFDAQGAEEGSLPDSGSGGGSAPGSSGAGNGWWIAPEGYVENPGETELPQEDNDFGRPFDPDLYDTLFSQAQGQYDYPAFLDPLIFDLNGDGIQTTSSEQGRYFDLDNDGFAQKMSFASVNDALLALDRNNNGVIDNGLEVFGNTTLLANGQYAPSGIAALAELDSNSDGVINSSDALFSSLKFLKGDGSLVSLADAGVSAIDLDYSVVDINHNGGNKQVKSATFVKNDGTTGQFGEFLLTGDLADTIGLDWIDVGSEIAQLPEVYGSGIVHTLQQTMAA